MPLRAATIAITTTIVESLIQNLNYGDADSLGLFQQRPSAGWGTPDQIRDPIYSTNKFLTAMLAVDDWTTKPIGVVCQEVQRTAFPDRNGQQAADGARIAAAAWSEGAGDYNADGYTDLALYRPDDQAGSTWWVRSGRTGTTLFGGTAFGGCRDVPAPGDYDGDGQTDLALYRPDCTNGSTWWVRSTRTGNTLFGGTPFGGCHDVPAT